MPLWSERASESSVTNNALLPARIPPSPASRAFRHASSFSSFAVFQNAYKAIKAPQKGNSSSACSNQCIHCAGVGRYVIHCRSTTRCTTVVPKLGPRKKVASVSVAAFGAIVCISAPFARYSASTAGRFSVALINAGRNINGFEWIF